MYIFRSFALPPTLFGMDAFSCRRPCLWEQWFSFACFCWDEAGDCGSIGRWKQIFVDLFLEHNSWLIVDVGTRKNLFVIKLSWSKNCRIDCEIICCVMVCVYPCCLFLVGTQDAGWSMVTCTLFWGARIVAGEICVLNWLRDDTLCHVISKCLLSTFWGGSFFCFRLFHHRIRGVWTANWKLEARL